MNVSGKIVIRKDAKKIVNKRGRKSGGILVLIDTEIKKGITIVENNNEYGIWLRLHKNYFMTENDIYMCGIYLPPGDSPYAIKKLFKVMENDICTFSNLGKVIIIGDTNGRVGEEPDFILPDEYNTAFPLLNFDYFPQKRISMDTITNKQGNQLLKLCKNTGMVIVNGRVLGFKPKERTTGHVLVLNTIYDIYKSKHKAVYMCFVDLEKAFDSVNRYLLLYKLLKINISSKFLHLVKSLYQDMHTCLKINNCHTNIFLSKLEHVKGAILVLTFSIYINDIPNFLQSNNSGYVMLNTRRLRCLMYADDIVLLSDSSFGMQK